MKQLNILIIALLLHLCSGTFAQTGRLAFIENRNQWQAAVKYKADIAGGAVFLTDKGFTYSFYDQGAVSKMLEKSDSGRRKTEVQTVSWHAYRVNFLGADTNNIHYTTEETRKEYYNFFLGNDPAKWAGKVPAHEVINQHGVYNGIDAKIYSNGSAMKYDFIVSPGADPSQIVLNFEGVKPELLNNGSLRIKTSVNEIIEEAPTTYQFINGERRIIKSAYRQLANGNIVFSFPEGYDKASALVIDPSLVFATYAGSTAHCITHSSGYDLNGALFVAGSVYNIGFPITVGAFQQNFASNAGPINPVTNHPQGTTDLGIQKISPDGSSLIYSTFYGGSSGEGSIDMNITPANELVLLGITASTDLPVTAGCFDNTQAGGELSKTDYFVAHFNEDGAALMGATYIGGAGDEAFDWSISQISIDADGNIVFVGNTESLDYPVTANAAQPANGVTPGIPAWKDGVVTKLSSDCSQLLYSTYLGGGTLDACLGLTLNAVGDIIVCGQTNSIDFPTTANVLHPTFQDGDMNGFLTVIDGVSGAIKASTYIAGDGYMSNDFRPRHILYDFATKVQVDENQNIIVAGKTWGGYPISPGVFSVTGGDCFLDRIAPDLSTSIQSTRMGMNSIPFGGGGAFSLTAFLYSGCGNDYTYLAGSQIYPGMPVTPDAYSATAGPGPDAFTGYHFSVLDKDWQNLVYGSYLPANIHWFLSDGNARFDDNGTLYHFASAYELGFPTTPGVFAPVYSQTQYPTRREMASFKFEFNYPGSNVPLVSLNDTILCSHEPFAFTASATNTIPRTSYEWSPADAVTPPSGSPTVTIDPDLGTDIVLLVKNGACGSASDTMHIRFSHVLNASINPVDTSICPGDTVLLVAAHGTTYTWRIEDAMATDGDKAFVWPDTRTAYSVIVSDTNNCEKEVTAIVRILPLPDVDAGPEIDMAYGASAQLNGSASGFFNWKYNVSPANILNPVVRPDTTTTYYLTVTDAKGCSATDSVTVYVISNGMPNAFSPNGDGLNDEFFPIFSPDSRLFPIGFSVYNRWGQRIFYSAKIKQGWDGTYQGAPVDAGTYFYYIEFKIGDKSFTKKGDVTLIR